MRDRDTDLLVRVLSTAVVVPLVVAAVLLGGWWLFGFLMLVATLAIAEYVSLLRALSYQPWLPFSLGLGWAVLAHAFLPDLGLLWPAVAVVLFASLCLHLWRDLSKTPLENWLLASGWGALHLVDRRAYAVCSASLPQGELWLLAVILHHCTVRHRGLLWRAGLGQAQAGPSPEPQEDLGRPCQRDRLGHRLWPAGHRVERTRLVAGAGPGLCRVCHGSPG